MPLEVGTRWAICGAHERDADVGDRMPIYLRPDPHGVYGAGYQWTTQAMLNAMAEYEPNFAGATVLDFGTGNGILAIAAARLGAAAVTALDSDPRAREVAAGQIAENGYESTISVRSAIDEAERWDIVLANIGSVEFEPVIARCRLLIAVVPERGRRLSAQGERPVFERDASYLDTRMSVVRRETRDGFVSVVGVPPGG